MANSPIISQVRRKNNFGNYDNFYIGPELRYSGALPASGNNNLEEQLLLGVSRIVKSWYDRTNDTEIQEIEFRVDDEDSPLYRKDDYYILKYSVIKDHILNVDGETLYFGDGTNMAVDENNVLIQKFYTPKLTYDAETETLVGIHTECSETSELKYVPKNGSSENPIDVSSKIRKRGTDSDNKTVFKEVVENYLT